MCFNYHKFLLKHSSIQLSFKNNSNKKTFKVITVDTLLGNTERLFFPLKLDGEQQPPVSRLS